MRYGKGKWENTAGNKYVGEYENDMKNGFGEF